MTNDPFPSPDHPIDRLVRQVRDAEAARIDGDRMLARLNQAMPARKRPLRRWLLTAAGAMAAAVLVAVFLMVPSGKTVAASPAEVVAEAKVAHTANLEQAYRVTTRWIPGGRKKFFFPEVEWETILHAKGDRFYLERGDGKPGAWGRDEKGRAWAALGPKLAIAFEGDETPEAMREYLDVRSMQPAQLLEYFLKSCDLTWGDEAAIPGTSRQIVATPREDAATSLKWAKLSLRSDQNLIERLVIERQPRPGETVQITFERIDLPPPDPAKYSPEGHLDPGGKVWDHNRPMMRLQFFREFLGHKQ
ncbi:hypothetical protein [Zavarzinella formosa]|uniref:hypothetical protein n=1 Tax=Zavarzinella formosa TaxID=360055 RepID=UPI0002E11AC3|nr:hypothetical protein [Zavarzinella formosa]